MDDNDNGDDDDDDYDLLFWVVDNDNDNFDGDQDEVNGVEWMDECTEFISFYVNNSEKTFLYDSILK